MRSLSLDELPQLFNVAKGEMSLVGPRPLFSRYEAYYSQDESKRHWVRPGITGLAQVSGRNSVGWTQRLAQDVAYVTRHSMRLDIEILARTIRQAVASTDVSVIAGDTGDPLDVERTYPRSDAFALRRLYAADLEQRVAWFQHPLVRRYMTLPDEVTLTSTREWYRTVSADHTRYDFSVYDLADGVVVGMGGLKTVGDSRDAELYLVVDPERRGQGIGSQTCTLIIKWAQRQGPYDAVVLTVDTANIAAIRIYQNLGFATTSSMDRRQSMRLDLRDAA
jgi:RimJ/RimL family protein N-acetyltransferase